MIIKPTVKRYYARIPNELLNDGRLSIEARGMIAYLFARPSNWIIHPEVIMRHLGVRRKKLDRMYREAMNAGYMARSVEQTHDQDGSWGPFKHIVGMPADVATARRREQTGISLCGQPKAHAPKAQAPGGTIYKEKKNYQPKTDKKGRRS